MGIQWKLGKEKELKINATFSAGALSKDIWCDWQNTDLGTGSVQQQSVLVYFWDPLPE